MIGKEYCSIGAAVGGRETAQSAIIEPVFSKVLTTLHDASAVAEREPIYTSATSDLPALVSACSFKTTIVMSSC